MQIPRNYPECYAQLTVTSLPFWLVKTLVMHQFSWNRSIYISILLQILLYFGSQQALQVWLKSPLQEALYTYITFYLDRWSIGLLSELDYYRFNVCPSVTQAYYGQTA
jgi:hypothetical protein